MKPRLHQLVLTATKRAAVVVRLDGKADEATVRRLDDGALVSFRTSLLQPLADGLLILSAPGEQPIIEQEPASANVCTPTPGGEA